MGFRCQQTHDANNEAISGTEWSLTNFKTAIRCSCCLHNGLLRRLSRVSCDARDWEIKNLPSTGNFHQKSVSSHFSTCCARTPKILRSRRLRNQREMDATATDGVVTRETKSNSNENMTTLQSIKQTISQKLLFQPLQNSFHRSWFGSGMRETNKIDWEPAAKWWTRPKWKEEILTEKVKSRDAAKPSPNPIVNRRKKFIK